VEIICVLCIPDDFAGPTGAAGFSPSLANASAGRRVEGSWLDSSKGTLAENI
jgi:hypothetical protein